MTVENISWSISTKECCRPRRGLNPRPPGLQSDGASNWATEAGKEIMYYLHKTTSAVSCVKPNASQWEATLRDDVGFATVYCRIYHRKFLTLSNQTSCYIPECIRIQIDSSMTSVINSTVILCKINLWETKYTVEPQWLEHIWDHGNSFRTWVVRSTEVNQCTSLGSK